MAENLQSCSRPGTNSPHAITARALNRSQSHELLLEFKSTLIAGIVSSESMCGGKCSRIYRACWHLFRGTGCCHAKPFHPPSRTHAPEDRLFLKVNNYRILITGTNTSQYRLPVLIKLWMLIFFAYLSNRGKNLFFFRYIKKVHFSDIFLRNKKYHYCLRIVFRKKIGFQVLSCKRSTDQYARIH